MSIICDDVVTIFMGADKFYYTKSGEKLKLTQVVLNGWMRCTSGQCYFLNVECKSNCGLLGRHWTCKVKKVFLWILVIKVRGIGYNFVSVKDLTGRTEFWKMIN